MADDIEIVVPNSPEDGTAIGTAIGTSVNRLKYSRAESKIVILLTDGQNNWGWLSPLEAAELAKKMKVKVYTIGAGSVRNGFFAGRTSIDEPTLKEIARRTDGQYFRATDTESLEKIYFTIDKLEKSEFKAPLFSVYKELAKYFIIAGAITLMLELILRETWLRQIP